MQGAIPKGAEVSLPSLPAGWQLVTTAVLADGDLGILATNADLAYEWRRNASGLVLGKPGEVAARAEARLWCFNGKELVDGPSFTLETPFPIIGRFDDGRWLVAASRTGSEPNARVLASDGQLLDRFRLGDGIAHVGIDRHDQIWVGWFDEGVFGNDGWRVPGEEWPPSSRGVGLFSTDGSWQRLSVAPEKAGDIADCYALNVLNSGEGAWACPYTDFPLLHLRPGCPVRWWSSEFTGPRAIAVYEGHAHIAGGYGSDADRLALVTLNGEGNGDAARTVAKWRLPLAPRLPQWDEPPDVAERHPWQRPTLLAGRGDTIHLVQDGVWHRWRVPDTLIAARRVNSPEA